MEVVELYSKLMGLWSELPNYIKIPNTTYKCTCGKCDCNTDGAIIKMMEENKTHHFLMGLDDDLYSNIRGQILALSPMPPLDRMFNMVQQEENHKQMMRNRENKDENMAAFAVSYGVELPLKQLVIGYLAHNVEKLNMRSPIALNSWDTQLDGEQEAEAKDVVDMVIMVVAFRLEQAEVRQHTL